MKLVKPSFEIKNQGYSLQDIYKHIEWVGRHCYKSHDKITETSAEEFVNRMIKSGHGAMLEHGTVYLHTGWNLCSEETDLDKYGKNKFSRIAYSNLGAHVTTNLRVLVENNWLDDLKYLCEPTEYHYRRTTVKFICSRSTSHQLVRHRSMNFVA